MPRNCKQSLLLVLIGMMPVLLAAQTYERSKEVVRTFRMNRQAEVQIINKYGNVHVVNWDQDSVKFEIKLVVKGNKQSKIQRNFDMIDFNFTRTAYYVVAETVIGDGKGSFWDEVSDLASTIFSSSNRTQIDYKVYMPADCPLKIDNKFGNIYIGDQRARADINLSNGDIKANAFKDELRLTIDFGNANIRSMQQGRILSSYGELEIRQAGNIRIESKSSHIEIGTSNELQLDSRRDDIRIEEVAGLSGSLSFSDLDISNFTGTSLLSSSYGTLMVRSVTSSFKSLRIKAEYTDIDINFDRNAAYSLSLEHADKSEISLPADFEVQSETKPDEGSDALKVTGTMGEGGNPSPVDITIKAGHVFITNY